MNEQFFVNEENIVTPWIPVDGEVVDQGAVVTVENEAADTESVNAEETSVEEIVEETQLQLENPEPMNFVKNLDKMGIGMLGIFIVIALIMAATYALNKIFSGKKKD